MTSGYPVTSGSCPAVLASFRWGSAGETIEGELQGLLGYTGNGAGNAVVAAYVLAGELAAAGDDHQAALARYERRLRGYIAGGQKRAVGRQAFLAPPTWKKIRQRNRLCKMLSHLPVEGLIARAATKPVTAITLPGYGDRPGRRLRGG